MRRYVRQDEVKGAPIEIIRSEIMPKEGKQEEGRNIVAWRKRNFAYSYCN